jgi:hypothetical protein
MFVCMCGAQVKNGNFPVSHKVIGPASTGFYLNLFSSGNCYSTHNILLFESLLSDTYFIFSVTS